MSSPVWGITQCPSAKLEGALIEKYERSVWAYNIYAENTSLRTKVRPVRTHVPKIFTDEARKAWTKAFKECL